VDPVAAKNANARHVTVLDLALTYLVRRHFAHVK
jgi:hypothetical protein